MLDSTTKRKIDTARQILVGKVPDPKSQIEQITLALIYKFMNDTDKLSVEIGGKPSYFTDDYERFSWDNIIDPRLTGQERMNLYTEGLERMGRNPKLPELFRNIFKNAFLPFRDSNTLNMFLEEINGFEYDHSENLGDAYEYLLSIMSSQGDAGQFRTPRHIIDFIVSVVNPQKHDTILDPACGTAGFLISAIKHIKKANTKDYEGDLLNIDEQQQLADSVVGYDISPDMRRISLVNMFLHNINDPHIYEYDTLSSNDRWEDDFSCILANPPFMSPKGGIKPHERFPIPSTRSEVLFVDYIMEHLTIDGKAGVIVPEGIIFQSQKAFQSLRKKMVDDSFLWAVVSLPSGVFNPYSGVKTSILFFDREIAQKTDEILFVKIEADGYNLGAQRKPIEQNDLPEAYDALTYYKDHLKLPSEDRQLKANGTREIAHTAKKQDIANQDYNLSAGRYVISEIRQGKWQRVKLGEVSIISSGNSAPQDQSLFINGKYPFFRTSDVASFHCTDNLLQAKDHLNENGIRGLKLFPKGTILFPKSGASILLNHRAMMGVDAYVSSHLATIIPEWIKILPKFLYHLLVSFDAKKLVGDQSYPSLKCSEISKIEIPIPPLSVQKDIVEEIESYQKIIDGAKQVVENWKPRIDIDPEWKIKKIGDFCRVDGQIIHNPKPDGIYIGADSIESNTGILLKTQTIKEQKITGPVYHFRKGKLLYSKIRPYLNKLCIVDFEGYCSSDIYPLDFDNSLLIDYAQYYMLSNAFLLSIKDYYQRARIPKINRTHLMNILIPVPDLKIQRYLVSEIAKELSYIDTCNKLTDKYNKKIRNIIMKLWRC